MDIKSKKFSHSTFVKVIVFLLIFSSIVSAIYAAISIYKETNGNIEIIFEKNFLESSAFQLENIDTINQIADLIDTYVSEENILAGHTITEDELTYRIQEEFWDREAEAVPDEEVKKIKQEIIAESLKHFQFILDNLDKKEGLLYYATDGENTFTNTDITNREQFEKYPVYYVSEGYDWHMSPNVLDPHSFYYDFPHVYRAENSENTKLFVGYTKNYIEAASNEWMANKTEVMNKFYFLIASVVTFFISLFYLIITTGRNFFKDEIVHMNLIDKLYVDINIFLLFVLTMNWFILVYDHFMIDWLIFPYTLVIASICIVLLLSLVRHVKNKTFFKHTLLFVVFHWLSRFIKDIYDSGSVGTKVVVIVILYPIITVASLIFFPITISIAAWLALKKVKDFNKIQVGAKMMRDGHLQHRIEVDGKGELAILAANINQINEGFKQAVHNELKNERMKTELITNVSHDIRTPLTSLITYTDLLKTETDPEKVKEYIGILDQKSKRLQVLTDDLFAAAKASSGDIPVNLQHIDIVALVNQGIGEVSEQIEAKNLSFIFNHPKEKMYVIADGKLLWRSMENILSNIFNYALEGSRVYIDLTHKKDEILLIFKNISKYELNITEEALIERFKRGDESRTSQGSGLGLSITKSLIENQQGKFEITIDGDLFKSMIYLPRVQEDDLPDMS